MITQLPRSLAQDLLDLFAGPLRDVRFPDADGPRLSGAVEAERAAVGAVEEAEAALVAARADLAACARNVAAEAERALAYARVYAIDHPEVATAIGTLAAARTGRGPGRPRKDGTAAPAPGVSRVRLGGRARAARQTDGGEPVEPAAE